MGDISAQMILDEMGLPIGTTIPLPYGLTLEIKAPFDLGMLCNNEDQEQAMKGLLGVCQGVLITLSEATVIELAHLVLLVNSHLGVMTFVRDAGIIDFMSKINTNVSLEEFINNCMINSGLLDIVQENFPDMAFQYLEFEEIVPLWWKIVNSSMIYVMRDNYSSTSYSTNSGLDDLAHSFFFGG